MDLSDAIDRFRGPLLGLIGSWGAPHVDASEIAQQSFVDAYLNRHRCRGDWQDADVFGPWLSGIARNNFRNWHRSRKRRERRVISVDTATLEQTVGKEPACEDHRIVELRIAIDKLPTKLLQVILMHVASR